MGIQVTRCDEIYSSTKEWTEAVPALLTVVLKTSWKNMGSLRGLKKDEHSAYFEKERGKGEFTELQNCQTDL